MVDPQEKGGRSPKPAGPGKTLAALAAILPALAAIAALSACAAPAAGHWQDPSGLTLSWTPAQPRFGDLLTLRAWSPDPLAAGPEELRDPQGAALSSLGTERNSLGSLRVWSFRILSAGAYTWAGTELWRVASEAKEATELKRFDAQGLWEGQSRALPPAGAASKAAGGQP